MSSESGPTSPSERIVALDALRGFALLGILIINIRLFSMPEVVLLNPTAYGDFTGANYWAWFAGYVFVQGKFLTLFTVLFGAGIVLFTGGGGSSDTSRVSLHFRRIGFLVLFGFAHAYLLWYGDILVLYGLCGFGVVFLRDRPPRALAAIGLVLLAILSSVEVLTGLAQGASAIGDQWQPAASTLQAEVETYRSGYLAQMDHRLPTALERQTSGFIGYSAWRLGGPMLLGMALYKWGILTNERSRRFYAGLVAAGAAVGLGLILAGVWYIQANNWSAGVVLFWRQFNLWGSIALAAAYIGLVMLYADYRPEGPITRGLAAVGRTAFSNYILQSVLATTIFYGHGLGLFGQVSRVEALGVVVAIWAVQIPLSVLWLRYFRYGPIEWVWRTLTYGERQPLRLDASGESTNTGDD